MLTVYRELSRVIRNDIASVCDGVRQISNGAAKLQLDRNCMESNLVVCSFPHYNH
jgi:hypothetical protein